MMIQEPQGSRQEPAQLLNEIFDGIGDLCIHRRHGAKFRYRIYLTKTMAETGIEALELSVRAYNCLKRAGYSQIGKLAEDIAGDENMLAKIRNCGKRSEEEIKVKLFIFQYESLKPEKKPSYLAETIVLNLGGREDG